MHAPTQQLKPNGYAEEGVQGGEQRRMAKRRFGKNRVMLLAAGIFHLIWGICILSLGAIIEDKFVKVFSDINTHATAIWSSFVFIFTGVLSIIIFWRPRNRILISTHNVLAILCILFGIGVVIAGAYGADYYDCKRIPLTDEQLKSSFFKAINQYLETPFEDIYNVKPDEIEQNQRFLYYPIECNDEDDKTMARPVYFALIFFGSLEIIGGCISIFFGFRLYTCFTPLIIGCTACCNECQEPAPLQYTETYKLKANNQPMQYIEQPTQQQQTTTTSQQFQQNSNEVQSQSVQQSPNNQEQQEQQGNTQASLSSEENQEKERKKKHHKKNRKHHHKHRHEKSEKHEEERLTNDEQQEDDKNEQEEERQESN